MARMTPEELQEILDLAFCDGDEVAVIRLAKTRKVFTNCCTYSYTGLSETDDNPFGEKEPPKKDDKKDDK